MAVNAGSVYAELILNMSKYEENLKKAENQMKTFTDKLGKIGKGMKKAGDTLSKHITVPIIGAGAAATKLGMDFEAQMSRVQGISGATGAELDKLNEVALQLGADTAFSASEVASAMENLASAGFTTNEIIAAIPGNLDLAAASGTDLATATDIAASILRGFQLDASEAGRVADVLAEAANRTNAGVEDMGEAMKYIAPVANAMGLSLEETAAAVGILSDAGIKGSQAGTTLRGALTRLTKPTKQMQEVMNQLGLEFFDAQGNMKPLTEIIAELEEGTKGLTQEQKNQALATLFGQESLSGMLVLIEQGPEKLSNLTKEFENSSGAAQEAADIMMNNTKGTVEEMMGALETAGIKIFQAVAPTITDLAKKVGELADKFSALPEETQKNIIKFAALVAAIGPVLSIGGKLAGGVSSIIGLFGKFKAASTAATAATSATATGFSLAGAAAKAGALLLNPWVLGIAAATAGGIALYKHLQKDSIPAVDLFGETVSESTQKAVGGFLELNDKATLALNQLSWSGQEVTQEMATNIANNFSQMAKQVQAGLDSHYQESLQKMQAFVNNSTSLSEEEQEQILANMQQGYENKKQAIEEGEARIKAILTNASNEKRALTKEEQEEINTIQKQMVDTGIQVLSENELEAKAIMERMKQQAGEISARQAAEVVQNSLKQKEEAIKAAEEQYNEVIKEIIRQRDEAGTISAEQADKLIQEATRQKDEAIAKATEMHNKVVEQAKLQAGEHVNQVDWETGEIKTKWEVMKDDIQTKAKEIKENVKEKWEEIKQNTAEKWNEIKTDLANDWNNIKTNTSTTLQNIKENVANKWEEIKTNTSEKWSSIRTTISEKASEIKNKIVSSITSAESEWDSKTSAMESTKSRFDSLASSVRSAFSRIKNAITDGINALLDWNSTKVENKTATFTTISKTVRGVPGGGGVRAFARGTNYAPGGLALVGEEGPELIELPRGSKVHTAQQTERIMKGAGGGITQHIIINSPTPLSPSEIARKNLQVSRQLAMEWGL